MGNVFFVSSLLAAILAPLWRRSRKAASTTLALGSVFVLTYVLFDWVHPDVRIGQGAIEANRRFDLITLACEGPVLGFALISLKRFQKVGFWIGWVFNLGYCLYLTAIVVWLEFFWHW